MDDQHDGGSRPQKKGGVVWLLVLLAVVLIWWWWKPAKTNHASPDGRAALTDYDPDDVLVDLKDSATDQDVKAIDAKYGVDLQLVDHDPEALRTKLYRAHVDAAHEADLLAALSHDGRVEIAEPDALYGLSDPTGPAEVPPENDPHWKGFPNDPQYKYQWHLRQIDMPGAWKLGDGAGVVVAVIDTGVAYENYKKFHRVPDLAGTKFTKGYDFVNDTVHGNDDHGHGTHVAGTIAQSTHNGVGVAGVAPAATIMPLKVLSARGSGSVAGIADAIRYAADNGAKVINMSLGGRMRSKILEKAVKYAHDKGVVVVCAAGNDGSGRVSYPAAYPGAVAVAATQFDEATTFYSNWGKEIDVAAPGGNTQVDQNGDGMPDGVLQNTIVVGDPTKDGYFGFMGTSMASPHVAGVAALVVGAGVTNPDEVEKILKDSARAPKSKKLDHARYGAGIIDARAAILKAKAGAGGSEFALGLVLAGAVAFTARRRLSAKYLAGMMVGASGLFFLPYLGGVASWPVLSTLSRGFPSWDMSLLGAAGHGNVLFFSALAPLLALAIGYGVAKFRAPLAGFAVGVAAHLVFHAVVRMTDIHWMAWDAVWLVGNAAVLTATAIVALRD